MVICKICIGSLKRNTRMRAVQCIEVKDDKLFIGLGKQQKKYIFLVAVPLSGGGGVKGLPLRKKFLFYELFFYFVAI